MNSSPVYEAEKHGKMLHSPSFGDIYIGKIRSISDNDAFSAGGDFVLQVSDDGSRVSLMSDKNGSIPY